ncbi:ferredoxin--NADP reductase [Kiloniella majae]|uniref:ferredoxin--NADP reductase n=1 Tax=Kiloniella majae TaxID=1938558 RepID=UPI0023EA6034|nr:ferredoxin--NADP reductase [Kiloniella majae]
MTVEQLAIADPTPGDIMATTEKPLPKSVTGETVLSVTHHTDSLFSFRITRPAAFRFRTGEFVMIGLMVDGKPLLRAYSIASPAWDETIELYSIKVPNGPLTSRLQNIKPGDMVLLGKKPTGTLVLDALVPGKRLYMMSTGTGLAPFASVIRDPETYEKFEEVILIHSCRYKEELKYGEELVSSLYQHEFLGEMVSEKLRYYNSVTREDFIRRGRIPELFRSGKITTDLETPALNPETDRVMICGSMEMLKSCAELCEEAGLSEGANSKPGEYVVEKAFVG